MEKDTPRKHRSADSMSDYINIRQGHFRAKKITRDGEGPYIMVHEDIAVLNSRHQTAYCKIHGASILFFDHYGYISNAQKPQVASGHYIGYILSLQKVLLGSVALHC